MVVFESLPTQSLKQTRLEYYNELSKYTYDNHQESLGLISTVFPTYLYVIPNWKQYSTGTHSNIGKEIEQVLVNYSLSKDIFSERGHDDIVIGDKQIEIKSSKDNVLQSHLQTSFCTNTPNKFYCFVTNTSLPDLTLRVISSEILYYLSLGKTITDELASTGNSSTLEAQLKEGLSLMDFYPLLDNLMKTGHNLKSTKSFKIGDKVRIRFITQIELL
jgi:hypothetical protein